jgi:hypothetical protein
MVSRRRRQTVSTPSLQFAERGLQALVVARCVEVALHIPNVGSEGIPVGIVCPTTELFHTASQPVAEIVIAPGPARKTGDARIGREASLSI